MISKTGAKANAAAAKATKARAPAPKKVIYVALTKCLTIKPIKFHRNCLVH